MRIVISGPATVHNISTNSPHLAVTIGTGSIVITQNGH